MLETPVVVQIVIFLFKDIFVYGLEYLANLLTSWPAVVFFLTIVFIRKFEKEIRNILLRVRKFGKEGVELQKNIPQEETIEEEEIKKEFEDLENLKKKKEDAESVAKKALDLLEEKTDSLFYEKVYNRIYGSQIRLLEELRRMQGGTIAKTLREIFYDGSYIRMGGTSAYNFEMYLNFLKTGNLVKYSDLQDLSVVKITKEGLKFLDYIEGQSYLKLRPF